MVDLHGRRGRSAPLEGNVAPCVRVVQETCGHLTVGVEDGGGQVSFEDGIACRSLAAQFG